MAETFLLIDRLREIESLPDYISPSERNSQYKAAFEEYSRNSPLMDSALNRELSLVTEFDNLYQKLHGAKNFLPYELDEKDRTGLNEFSKILGYTDQKLSKTENTFNNFWDTRLENPVGYGSLGALVLTSLAGLWYAVFKIIPAPNKEPLDRRKFLKDILKYGAVFTAAGGAMGGLVSLERMNELNTARENIKYIQEKIDELYSSGV